MGWVELMRANVDAGGAGGPEGAETLDEMERDIERSREVRLEDWSKRPWWQRGLETIAKGLIEQY